jgi:beta-glucosidase
VSGPVEADVLSASLARLDPRQRAELTAGESGWSTRAAAGAGLERMLMGDGPLGLVSPTFDERETALLLPCGMALGATWDEELVRRVAEVQASEAVRRGYAAVYTPNLNLARTGLSGRSFEMFSEDPVLAGLLGAAFVTGLQGQGVAGCPKHLVCNDTETQRQRMSVTVDEATLREVYLRPFELALTRGGAWMVMAAYNRVNGIPCSQQAAVLRILKDEWGWDGVVVSDYFALQETVGPVLAGLDLEMPGPGIHLGQRLLESVETGQVPPERVDDTVIRLLRLADRTGSLTERPRQAGAPERHVPADEAPTALTEAAAASFTLVQNTGDLLPLIPGTRPRLAVIGPNATHPTFQGATFGRVRPASFVTPADAIARRFGTGSVVVEPGLARTRPEPLGGFAVSTPDGRPGVLVEHFRDGSDPVLSEVRADSSFVWFGVVPGVGPTMQPSRLRLTAVFTPSRTGRHVFGGGGSGDTTVLIDGDVVARRPAPAPSDVMGEVARAEMSVGAVNLVSGVPVAIEVLMKSAGARVQALTVGCLPPQPADAFDRAVTAAAAADAVVLMVGDVLETSRESVDLTSSALPADQVDLIRAVAAVNARTVVVVNAGRPVDAAWADDVAAVLYAWLPGQQFGPALAAALAGDIEPAGRLPVSIPFRDEDRSTWGERLDEDLTLDYTATEPTGYRHLQRTRVAPRFAFGAGLGYATWDHDAPSVTVEGNDSDRRVTVRVRVTNTGRRPGREVVQAYVRGPGELDARLAGFAGVRLTPGEAVEVLVVLPDRAFARWDTDRCAWSVATGTHEILLGRSSVDIANVLGVPL